MKLSVRGTLVAAILASSLVMATAAAAQPAPAWTIRSFAAPTHFTPGDESGNARYEVTVENSGGGHSNGNPLTLTDTLPPGLLVKDLEFLLRKEGSVVNVADDFCDTSSAGGSEIVTCSVPSELPESTPASIGPSEGLRLTIFVAIPTGIVGELENRAKIQGGGAPSDETVVANDVSAAPATAGFQEFDSFFVDEKGAPVTGAGAHPFQYTTSFAVNTNEGTFPGGAPFVPADGDIKTIEVDLPPGFIGNPTAALQCNAQDFTVNHPILLPESNGFFTANDCPDASAVGVAIVSQIEGAAPSQQVLGVPIYNLIPPPGMPAQFGFQVLGASFYVDTKVRTGDDYGITAVVRNVSELRRVTANAAIFWGVPADKIHDPIRGACLNQVPAFTFDSLGECSTGLSAKPFFRLPTRCQGPLESEMRFDTWTNPGTFVSADSTLPALSNCAKLAFSPQVEVVPDATAADSPAGLRFNLHLPQIEAATVPSTADLKDAIVRLPAGVSVNPASAAGLAGCSSEQVELHGPKPAECPDASKIGTVNVHTPLLDHPVKGSVFVASQGDNPFGTLLALYIAVNDPQSGVVLKLAGKVESDPVTGQLTTRFTENPQLPFEDLTVTFFGGPRAPLRTPGRCGGYETTTELTPWSSPESGPPATPSDSFDVVSGPNGGPCPDGRLDLGLSAGATIPTAGAYSPFLVRLSRPDGSAQIAGVGAVMPLGLSGKLAGIPYCPETSIAQAAGRSGLGEGAQEAAQPSCPATSRVGTVRAGVGAGPAPFFTTGDVYLAGPYKGGPFSLVAIVPAMAGPFDLGVVTNRIPVYIDSETAQVSAISDPLPTILAGIPLALKDIRIELDRAGFMRNPTSCEARTVQVTAFAPSGEAATAADKFKVGACAGLPFSPDIKLRLKGATKRTGHPALRAELKGNAKEAGVSRVSAVLPPSLFIDQSHISNPCTRVQFNADACPKSSVLGTASIFTPLLDRPLEGKIYFRSNGGERELPDIVVDVNGQIHVTLVGFVDSVSRKGSEVSRTRTRFNSVPDAPFSKAVLNFFGGKRGLLVNSRNLCGRVYRADVKMLAHNGRRHVISPKVKAGCGKKR